MNAPQHAQVFGADSPSSETVTLSTIAAQIQALKPRALPPASHEDVVTLLEYMRDETLKAHQRNLDTGVKLAAREEVVAGREREVSKREKLLATHQRAFEAAGKTRSLLRYFRK